MNIDKIRNKSISHAFRKLLTIIIQHPRIFKYKLLSSCKQITGKPILYQPVQINGKGKVIFHENVCIGFNSSPFLFNGYAYIDSRKDYSKIEIESDCRINNNFVAISEGDGIHIGSQTLIGSCCEIIDSEFHNLNPLERIGGIPTTGKVVIGKNVFIGSNVKILKGVVIGENSVIANGSVVTASIPENVVAAGVPAKVVRKL